MLIAGIRGESSELANTSDNSSSTLSSLFGHRYSIILIVCFSMVMARCALGALRQNTQKNCRRVSFISARVSESKGCCITIAYSIRVQKSGGLYVRSLLGVSLAAKRYRAFSKLIFIPLEDVISLASKTLRS